MKFSNLFKEMKSYIQHQNELFSIAPKRFTPISRDTMEPSWKDEWNLHNHGTSDLNK